MNIFIDEFYFTVDETFDSQADKKEG